jgi:hypothetical protein
MSNQTVTIRVGSLKQCAVVLELDGYRVEHPHPAFDVWAVIVARGETDAFIESIHATEGRAVDHAKAFEAEIKGRIQ